MLKIAITGPESSGKTTLSEALCVYFNTPVIKEYAREFIENRKGKYECKDLDLIGLGQKESINSVNNNLVISDTDYYVLKIWSEVKFGAVSKTLNKLEKENVFDLYILCAPDIPWEEDPLRESQFSRDDLFKRYLFELEKDKRNYIIVSGSKENRLNSAISKIKEIIAS